MKKHLFMPSLLALALAFGVAACAATGAPVESLQNQNIRVFERDCPACEFSTETGKSANKPTKNFIGTFNEGEVCPFCHGEGKLFDIVDLDTCEVTSIGIATVESNKTRSEPLNEAQQKLMSERGAKIVALRNAIAAAERAGLQINPVPQNGGLDSFIIKNELIRGQEKPAAITTVKIPAIRME